MKTIGLMGGMSWESSLEYYRIINKEVQKRLGGVHSAKCLMYSVDFAEIEVLQHRGDWPELARILSQVGQALEAGGADFLVLCTNTMHKVASEIETAVSIPLLHIADPTADKIKSRGFKKVGLLGTRFTMEDDFYRGRLEGQHGLEVLVPDESDRDTVHKIIYQELVIGRLEQESKNKFASIIKKLSQQGAEGVILGCTEIGLLVKKKDSILPLFDTTAIHAEAAVNLALM
ncbi:MAG: aspartate/glutamate racemase family protein [Acidobacteriota bacterium]|nr:aspartate/glutamate racemase family protein [Acidobacteriota bacterium]MDW3229162.1 aspartate/glutamate racemase family protein [Acidobacteriota bacterium]MDY0231610.1 aspartate/glutamate racemase family protein [Candidatus Saccharicenans sp.]